MLSVLPFFGLSFFEFDFLRIHQALVNTIILMNLQKIEFIGF